MPSLKTAIRKTKEYLQLNCDPDVVRVHWPALSIAIGNVPFRERINQ